MKVWDVIISGAGIIGVSLALELRARGASVLILDRGEPGREASSAAAGMLAASDPDTPVPLRPLAYAGATLYSQFVGKIEGASEIKTDFRRGAIALLANTMVPPEHRLLSALELQELEPSINPGTYLPTVAENENSVDPDLLMQAAVRAARASGIELRGHTEVRQMRSSGGQVDVVTDKEQFLAKAAVNCQGAWSGAPVRPRKGQMLYLQPENPGLLARVLRTPEAYLVPRSSGRVLVGATVEDVGFDKNVDREVIADLHRVAVRFVPELAAAAVVSSWAGLRPGTPDDLPILGPTETPGVFIASGHFRNGILLAPITARIMADVIAGKAPELDISVFSAGRFANVVT